MDSRTATLSGVDEMRLLVRLHRLSRALSDLGEPTAFITSKQYGQPLEVRILDGDLNPTAVHFGYRDAITFLARRLAVVRRQTDGPDD